ncbi:MAG: co-chaperone GroES [Clostridia bacterium]|nr:co-chaperone GroES [Clostridia bacterium]
MKIRPLFDRIVVEPVEAEEKTKSGIVLLAKDQEKPQMAKVIAVGPGGNVDGKDVVIQVKVGDKVLCSKYAGSEFKVDGKDVTIMRQSDVLAVIE